MLHEYWKHVYVHVYEEVTDFFSLQVPVLSQQFQRAPLILLRCTNVHILLTFLSVCTRYFSTG